MRAISSSVGRHSYVVLSGEKNGTLHGIGEDCPAGHVDESGQGIGLFQGFCQIYKCEDGYNFFHTCKFDILSEDMNPVKNHQLTDAWYSNSALKTNFKKKKIYM